MTAVTSRATGRATGQTADQAVTIRNVGDRLRAGTIFTLTEAIDTRRPAGTHYISQGLSDSGFCVVFRNTATGRTDQMEFGVMVDLRSEGLGVSFLSSHYTKSEAQEAATNVSAHYPGAPFFVARRKVGRGPWDEVERALEPASARPSEGTEAARA